MAIRRPSGPLPLGNARPGDRRVVPLNRSGAGDRIAQGEIRTGSPEGRLPSDFGATGLKQFLGGRSSISRSFQMLTDKRLTPFFIQSGGGFQPERFPGPSETDVQDFDQAEGPRARAGSPKRERLQKVKLNQLLKNPETRAGLRNAGFNV